MDNNHSQRVQRADDAAFLLAGDVRIDLRRLYRGVPQELLNDPEIGACLPQMSGEAVTQLVRRHGLGDACIPRRVSNDLLRVPRCHRLAVPASEDESGDDALLRQISLQLLDKASGEDYHPILAALAAADPGDTLARFEVFDLEVEALADAEPRSIEELDE